MPPSPLPPIRSTAGHTVREANPRAQNAARARRPRTALEAVGLFRKWKSAKGYTVKEIAKVLGTSWESVHNWMYRSTRPYPKMRLAIERVTQGEVPLLSWFTEPERAEYRAKIEELEQMRGAVKRAMRTRATVGGLPAAAAKKLKAGRRKRQGRAKRARGATRAETA